MTNTTTEVKDCTEEILNRLFPNKEEYPFWRHKKFWSHRRENEDWEYDMYEGEFFKWGYVLKASLLNIKEENSLWLAMAILDTLKKRDNIDYAIRTLYNSSGIVSYQVDLMSLFSGPYKFQAFEKTIQEAVHKVLVQYMEVVKCPSELKTLENILEKK